MSIENYLSGHVQYVVSRIVYEDIIGRAKECGMTELEARVLKIAAKRLETGKTPQEVISGFAALPARVQAYITLLEQCEQTTQKEHGYSAADHNHDPQQIKDEEEMLQELTQVELVDRTNLEVQRVLQMDVRDGQKIVAYKGPFGITRHPIYRTNDYVRKLLCNHKIAKSQTP